MATVRGITVKKILATTQGRTYAIAGVTIFIVVLMFFLAIRPAFLSISDQNVQNDIKREYLGRLTEYENNLKVLAEQETKYQDKITSLDSYISSKRNDEMVTANLYAMAEKYNCQITVLGFDTNTPPLIPELLEFTNLQRVNINLNIKGSLDNVSQFLGQFENFPVALRITSFSYGGEEANPLETEDISFSIQSEYYFWLRPTI